MWNLPLKLKLTMTYRKWMTFLGYSLSNEERGVREFHSFIHSLIDSFID